MIDNHIYQGNVLNIDPRTVAVKRCLDMNDRALRSVVIGLGGKNGGMPREDHFCITVATEVMAIFCLVQDQDELKESLGRIIIGKTFDGKELYARDLHAEGAMTALLKDAIDPNLVQTLEGTPAFIHGGPFANIAHGCNSVISTKTALTLGDYVVTEGGFGADLGAEKFMDIKCRKSGLKPSCIVLVVTLKALKLHGNGDIREGFKNVKRHYANLTQRFEQKVVVNLNQFGNDTPEEIALFRTLCTENGMPPAVSDGFSKGGAGCIELAERVAEACNGESTQHYLYDLEDSIFVKIGKVAAMYGAKGVQYQAAAEKKIRELPEEYQKYPVCMAKTQYSFSDDPKLLNAPEDFEVTVRDIEVKNGSQFIVVLLGEIMTMPGLPKVPNAQNIDLVDGKITGLY